MLVLVETLKMLDVHVFVRRAMSEWAIFLCVYLCICF